MTRSVRVGRGDGGPAGEKPRVLLKDQAYEQLKSLIITGEYPPGTFLSENMLATRLGMSKTPVRSAVERLETAGFVTVSPQQGILVKALSLDEIIDHFEIRLALETFMMRRLAGHLTAEQDERIEANLQRQLVAAEVGDLATYGQLDPEFHQIFCECLGNDEITQVMLRLRDKLHRIVSRVIEAHPERMLSSYHEHVAIVEALRAGDGETAAARMEEHLAWGRRFLATR